MHEEESTGAAGERANQYSYLPRPVRALILAVFFEVMLTPPNRSSQYRRGMTQSPPNVDLHHEMHHLKEADEIGLSRAVGTDQDDYIWQVGKFGLREGLELADMHRFNFH